MTTSLLELFIAARKACNLNAIVAFGHDEFWLGWAVTTSGREKLLAKL